MKSPKAASSEAAFAVMAITGLLKGFRLRKLTSRPTATPSFGYSFLRAEELQLRAPDAIQKAGMPLHRAIYGPNADSRDSATYTIVAAPHRPKTGVMAGTSSRFWEIGHERCGLTAL